MSKLNVVRRCCSCGAILQTENKNEEGYIKKEFLENSNALVLFCDSCYAKQCYNYTKHELICSKDYLSMLLDAAASDALIVYVIDLFSFEASFPSEVCKAICQNPILVIANKRDLLPPNADNDALREYVSHRFRLSNMNVKKEDVVLTSLTSMCDIQPIADEIEKRRKRHDVYLIGANNAGKTLFLSSFLRGYQNKTFQSVVTSEYPHTSLRVLRIPLDSSSSIYDTPGTSIDNSMTHILVAEQARLGYPTEPVKARNFVLGEGECLCLGGLARIELREGTKTTVSFFGAKTIKTAKVHSKKADSEFFALIQKGSLFPQAPSLISPCDFAAYDVTIDESGSRDLGIEGYGWIRFEGKGQTFRVFVPKEVSIYNTRSKIPSQK